MQKNKFEIWVLKTTILDPRKSALLVFEEKPHKNVFSLCFGFHSALKTIVAQMSLRWYFWKRTEKKLLADKKAILAVFGGY